MHRRTFLSLTALCGNLGAPVGTNKDRYEYYQLGRWMWSTPAFVDVIGHPDAGRMFELAPARAAFDNGGVLRKIEFGADNANLRVVKSVNGDRLNEFIVSRINR